MNGVVKFFHICGGSLLFRNVSMEFHFCCFENLKHIKHWQKNSSVYLSEGCVSEGIFSLPKGIGVSSFRKPHLIVFYSYDTCQV